MFEYMTYIRDFCIAVLPFSCICVTSMTVYLITGTQRTSRRERELINTWPGNTVQLGGTEPGFFWRRYRLSVAKESFFQTNVPTQFVKLTTLLLKFKYLGVKLRSLPRLQFLQTIRPARIALFKLFKLT